MSDRYVDYLPVDEVIPADRNPKAHDEGGIGRSIGHFGLAELPLIDERTGRLVAGHGRHKHLVSLLQQGEQPPDGVRVDDQGRWLMPVVRGWSSRSDDDAAAYLVGSNQLTTKGGWNDHLLAEVLHDLGDAQMIDLTGFEATDLESLEFLLRDDAWDSDADRNGAGGGEPDDSKFWPKIDLRVPPEVFEAWKQLLNAQDGADDVEKLTAHLKDTGHYL